MDCFAEQVEARIKKLELTCQEQEVRKQLVVKLKDTLVKRFPKCEVRPFGSSVNSLGFHGCDLDVNIEFGPDWEETQAETIYIVADVLEESEFFSHVSRVPKARVPIVRLRSVSPVVHCDASFRNCMPERNTKLIYLYTLVDPRVRQLLMLVKYWARVQRVCGRPCGTRFSNYSLTMMVIFALQRLNPPLVLTVDELQQLHLAQGKERCVVDGWNCSFCEDLEALNTTKNAMTLRSLLHWFFDLYSTFDFKKLVICPFLGKPVAKTDFSHPGRLPENFKYYKDNVAKGKCTKFQIKVMCLQDPFELSYNMTRAIKDKGLRRFKIMCSRAAEICKTSAESDILQKLFTSDIDRHTLGEKKGLHQSKRGSEIAKICKSSVESDNLQKLYPSDIDSQSQGKKKGSQPTTRDSKTLKISESSSGSDILQNLSTSDIVRPASEEKKSSHPTTRDLKTAKVCKSSSGSEIQQKLFPSDIDHQASGEKGLQSTTKDSKTANIIKSSVKNETLPKTFIPVKNDKCSDEKTESRVIIRKKRVINWRNPNCLDNSEIEPKVSVSIKKRERFKRETDLQPIIPVRKETEEIYNSAAKSHILGEAFGDENGSQPLYFNSFILPMEATRSAESTAKLVQKILEEGLKFECTRVSFNEITSAKETTVYYLRCRAFWEVWEQRKKVSKICNLSQTLYSLERESLISNYIVDVIYRKERPAEPKANFFCAISDSDCTTKVALSDISSQGLFFATVLAFLQKFLPALVESCRV